MAQGRRDDALTQMRLSDAAAVRHFGEITGNRHRALRTTAWYCCRPASRAR